MTNEERQPGTPGTRAVILEDVTRILHDGPEPVTLVKNVSMSVAPGEFLAVTGPSGSGKSSLIYLIGLLDTPTRGRIFINGVDATAASPSEREMIRLRDIGFVFQFHFLLGEFSARDNVMLPMRKLGLWSPDAMAARADALLEQFALSGAGLKRPHQLSGGERQRVAIARALANDPLIVIADEPTGNLDSKNSEVVFQLFRRLTKEAGKVVIMVTHNLDLAARVDRHVTLVDGEIVNDGWLQATVRPG